MTTIRDPYQFMPNTTKHHRSKHYGIMTHTVLDASETIKRKDGAQVKRSISVRASGKVYPYSGLKQAAHRVAKSNSKS